MNPVVALGQGLYFLVTGIRPLFSMRTFLAIGGADSLALVGIIYVLKKGISPIYLGDAFVEIVLITDVTPISIGSSRLLYKVS